MDKDMEFDLGPQPIAKILEVLKLKPLDIVSKSTEQLTFKMVSKAVKGRRLTLKIQHKVLNALNKASGKEYVLKDLFNY